MEEEGVLFMEGEGPMYDLDEGLIEDISRRFSHHPPKGDQADRYTALRTAVRFVALGVCQNVPESRERSLALTKLEEAMMWANAGIARNE